MKPESSILEPRSNAYLLFPLGFGFFFGETLHYTFLGVCDFRYLSAQVSTAPLGAEVLSMVGSPLFFCLFLVSIHCPLIWLVPWGFLVGEIDCFSGIRDSSNEAY